jgi:hypothetical protein
MTTTRASMKPATGAVRQALGLLLSFNLNYHPRYCEFTYHSTFNPTHYWGIYPPSVDGSNHKASVMFVRTCGVFTERTLKQKMQADFQRIMDAQTLANEKESMLAEGGRIES